MAFNLYFAGSYAKEVDEKLLELGANRLYSQLNDRSQVKRWVDFMRNTGEERQLFIDSGAYSAHTKGKELDVDDYIKYVNERQGLFTVIAQVDKIPGDFGKKKTRQEIIDAPEQSWENYLYMRERVIDKDCLTPIFHQGEDFKHLERMLETTFDGKNIPYIGISPANDVSTKQKARWFEHVFRIIRDSSNPKVKTHAFGMTSLTMLEMYPFYSADSTAWCMTSSTGGVFTPYGTITLSDKLIHNKDHFNNLPKQAKEELTKYFAKHGFHPDDFKDSYKARGLMNAYFLLDWSKSYQFKGSKTFQRRLF